MEKKNLLAILAVGAVIVLAAAGYFFYPRKKEAPPPLPQQPAEQTPEDKTQAYGTLPELGTETLANPVGDKLPELNPVEKANPFRGGYANPFE